MSRVFGPVWCRYTAQSARGRCSRSWRRARPAGRHHARRNPANDETCPVARNILSDRLRRLVEVGILETRPASDGTAYQEYVLTAQGESLFPVVVALRQWGGKTICLRRASDTLA